MEFRVTGAVELFLGPVGWYYVAVPPEVSAACVPFAERGLVRVEALGDGVVWNTSLMPKGDGTQFVPLNARGRRALQVDVGDTVELRVRLRSPR